MDLTSLEDLPVEMRRAIVLRIKDPRDMWACVSALRLFREALTVDERRVCRYGPGGDNVFDSDAPLDVVADAVDCWGDRLGLDYERVLVGPARRGRMDLLRYAWETFVEGPAGAAFSPACACADPGRCRCEDITMRIQADAAIKAGVAAARANQAETALYLWPRIYEDLDDDGGPILEAAAAAGDLGAIEAIMATVDDVHYVGEYTIGGMVRSSVAAGHSHVAFWACKHMLLMPDVIAIVAASINDVASLERACDEIALPTEFYPQGTLADHYDWRYEGGLWAEAFKEATKAQASESIAWLVAHKDGFCLAPVRHADSDDDDGNDSGNDSGNK